MAVEPERASFEERISIEKNNADHIEESEKTAQQLFDDDLLSKYPLLHGQSKDELKEINRKVLKKLDYKFLPCITAMLLMK